MNQYHIEITLLAEKMTYDILVPDAMQVGTLAILSARAFSDLTGGRYIPAGNPILYDQTSKQILDSGMMVQNSGIKNGTRLLLY